MILSEEDAQYQHWKQLLCEETAEDRNARFVECERTGQLADFFADLDRAQQWARQQDRECLEQGKPAKLLGFQIRLTLMAASISSLIANINPTLLEVFLKYKIWSPQQGLAYALNTSDFGKRSEMLAIASAYLPEEQQDDIRHQALATLRTIPDRSDWVPALINIFPCLTEPFFAEAQQIALEGKSRFHREEVLMKIAPYFPKPLRTETFSIIAPMIDPDARSRAYLNLATLLPTNQQELALQQALLEAREVNEERSKANALEGIAIRFAECGYVEKGMAIAREISLTASALDAIVEIARYLPAEQNIRELFSAWNAAIAMEGPARYNERLSRIVRRIAEAGQLEQALALAQDIPDMAYRAITLASIATYLPTEKQHPLFEQAVSLLEESATEDGQIRYYSETACHQIAHHLAQTGRGKQALDIVCKIRTEQARANAFAEIASTLSASDIPIVLKTIQGIWDAYSRIRAMSQIAYHLSEQQRTLFLALILPQLQRIDDRYLIENSKSVIAIQFARQGKSTLALSLVKQL